jgi:hypothetical protein
MDLKAMHTKTEIRLRQLASASLEAAVKACDDFVDVPDQACALPNDAPDHAWAVFRDEALAQYAADNDGPRDAFLKDCAQIFEDAKEEWIFGGNV